MYSYGNELWFLNRCIYLRCSYLRWSSSSTCEQDTKKSNDNHVAVLKKQQCPVKRQKISNLPWMQESLHVCARICTKYTNMFRHNLTAMGNNILSTYLWWQFTLVVHRELDQKIQGERWHSWKQHVLITLSTAKKTDENKTGYITVSNTIYW